LTRRELARATLIALSPCVLPCLLGPEHCDFPPFTSFLSFLPLLPLCLNQPKRKPLSSRGSSFFQAVRHGLAFPPRTLQLVSRFYFFHFAHRVPSSTHGSGAFPVSRISFTFVFCCVLVSMQGDFISRTFSLYFLFSFRAVINISNCAGAQYDLLSPTRSYFPLFRPPLIFPTVPLSPPFCEFYSIHPASDI